MIKKTLTFEDFEGNSKTQDFYFNLSKIELLELEMEFQGGLQSYLTAIVEAQNGKVIMKTFRKIIEMSIGRKSEDGQGFVKSEEIKQSFMNSDAYSELLTSIVTDSNSAAAFVNGLMPAALQKKLDGTPQDHQPKQ